MAKTLRTETKNGVRSIVLTRAPWKSWTRFKVRPIERAPSNYHGVNGGSIRQPALARQGALYGYDVAGGIGHRAASVPHPKHFI